VVENVRVEVVAVVAMAAEEVKKKRGKRGEKRMTTMLPSARPLIQAL
jgi:hypothetical protein